MKKSNLKKISILIEDMKENINNNTILEPIQKENVLFKNLNGTMYEFGNCLETKKNFY